MKATTGTSTQAADSQCSPQVDQASARTTAASTRRAALTRSWSASSRRMPASLAASRLAYSGAGVIRSFYRPLASGNQPLDRVDVLRGEIQIAEHLLQSGGVIRVPLMGSRLNGEVVAQCRDSAAVQTASQDGFCPVLIEPGGPVQPFKSRARERNDHPVRTSAGGRDQRGAVTYPAAQSRLHRLCADSPA